MGPTRSGWVARASVTVLVSMCAALAACSSDDDGAVTDSTSTTTTSPAPETTESVATTVVATTEPAETVAPSTDAQVSTTDTQPPITGDPIRILHTVTSADNPFSGEAGIEAAIEAINTSGGIEGRPIEVVSCVLTDANATSQCAADTVADSTIIAAVGGATGQGEAFHPVLAAADIAQISPSVNTLADMGCGNCFTTQLGTLTLGASAAFAADALGASRVVMPFLDVPAGQQAPTIVDAAVLGPRGLSLAGTAPIPPTAADVGTALASLPGDADAMVVALGLEQAAQVLNQLRGSGSDYPAVVTASVFPPSAISTYLAGADANLYIVSPYRLSGPGYDAYQGDMAAAGFAGKADDNTQAIQAWLGVQILRDAIEAVGIENVSRKAILDHLASTSVYDTGGLTPVLDWTVPQTALGGAAPAVINSSYAAYVWDAAAGEYREYGDGELLDAFAPTD